MAVWNQASPRTRPTGVSRSVPSLGWLPWVLVAPLFLLPAAGALWAILLRSGTRDLALLDLWLQPELLNSLVFSVAQAGLSSLLALGLGLPGAWILSRYRFRGRSFFNALCGLPFVFPPLLFTLGFLQVWGLGGLVNQGLMALFGLAKPPLHLVYNFASVVCAHGLFNFPLVMGLVAALWRQRSGQEEMAARTLGAGEARIFLTVTLPGLLPGIVSALSLVFVYCFMSFAIPLVLGGGPRYATLEVAIYAAVSGQQDFARGGAIALLEILVAGGVLLVWARLPGGQAGESRGRDLLPLPRLQDGARGWGIRLWLGGIGFLALSPALALVWKSLEVQGRPGQRDFPSFASWQVVLGRGETWHALFNSLALALAVALVACLLALAILAGEARQGGRTGRSLFFALPMVLSSILLSLGYLLLFPLGAGWPVLVLVQATAAYPLAYRTLRSARYPISNQLEHAASLLGAGKLRVLWTIDLAMLRRSLASAFALSGALSLGEINSGLMLNVPDLALLGLQAYRLVGSYQYPQACVLGVLICLLAALCFGLSEPAGGGK